MAQECAICGKHKSPIVRHSKLRGKYNPTVKQHQKPNLQWVRVPVSRNRNEKGMPKGIHGANGMPVGIPGQRVKACTKCMKSLGRK